MRKVRQAYPSNIDPSLLPSLGIGDQTAGESERRGPLRAQRRGTETAGSARRHQGKPFVSRDPLEGGAGRGIDAESAVGKTPSDLAVGDRSDE